jgi:hypothetical protein
LSSSKLSLDNSVNHEWTVARFGAAVLLALAGACGGDDSSGADAAAVQDGSPPGDAAPGDAAVVDCSGDHRESADNSNDPFSRDNEGIAERSGLSLSAGSPGFTVCGQIDPSQANDLVADYDAFVFEVTGSEPIDLRIELSAAPGETRLGLDLYRVEDGLPVQLATVPFRNGYALVAGMVVQPGSYWISAVGWLPAPRAPVGYAIAVRENQLSCPRSQEAPDYVETLDGEGRGNDVVSVELPDQVALTEGDDQPELTGLVLEPGTNALVAGSSADISSIGDSYLDRDAFLVATGANTSELQVRLSWADGDGDVDLDLYLFEAGAPENDFSAGLGATIGAHRDEIVTLNVDPDREYWLWVGAFDSTGLGGPGVLPRDYEVTLCPRQHEPL